MKKIEEEIAELLYQYDGGIHPYEYKNIFGKDKRLWKTSEPWDSQSDVELCEWERDEYRATAKVILERLMELNLLKYI